MGIYRHKVTKNVSFRRDSLDAELLDSIAQLAKRQAEQFCRLRLVVPGFLQRIHNGLALYVLNLLTEFARRWLRPRRFNRPHVQVIGHDFATVTERHGTLQHVLQLTHVAGKGITEECTAGALFERRRLIKTLQYVIRQQQDVVAALA